MCFDKTVGRTGYRLSPPNSCKKLFFFSKISRLILKPAQPSVKWIKGDLSSRPNRREVRLTTHCHTVPRLRMKGALPQLSHLLLWSDKGQIYIHLTLLLNLSHA